MSEASGAAVPDPAARASASARGTRRARKRAETHVRLVEAALEAFAERGYEATTMEDVAERADVAVRTAFRYFPAKPELVFADYEAEIGRWGKALDAAGAQTPLASALRTASHAVVARLLAQETFWDRVWTTIGREPGLAARAQRSQAIQQAHLADAIGRRCGLEPAADLRPAMLATGVVAALEQARSRWYASDKAIDLPSALDAALDGLADVDALLASSLGPREG